MKGSSVLIVLLFVLVAVPSAHAQEVTVPPLAAVTSSEVATLDKDGHLVLPPATEKRLADLEAKSKADDARSKAAADENAQLKAQIAALLPKPDAAAQLAETQQVIADRLSQVYAQVKPGCDLMKGVVVIGLNPTDGKVNLVECHGTGKK